MLRLPRSVHKRTEKTTVISKIDITYIVIGMAVDDKGIATHVCYRSIDGATSVKSFNRTTQSGYVQLNYEDANFYQSVLKLADLTPDRGNAIIKFVIYTEEADAEAELHKEMCLEKIKPYLQDSDEIIYKTILSPLDVENNIKAYREELCESKGFYQCTNAFNRIAQQNVKTMLGGLSCRELALPDIQPEVHEIKEDHAPEDSVNAPSRMINTSTKSDPTFLQCVKALEDKVKDLENRKEWDAANYAKTLARKLSFEYKKFQQTNNYGDFKKNTTKAVDIAKFELAKHRNCKWILANIGYAIMGLGAGYALFCIFYNKRKTDSYWCHAKTDAYQKAEAVMTVVNRMENKK